MASAANFAVKSGCHGAVPLLRFRNQCLAQRRFSEQAAKISSSDPAVGSSAPPHECRHALRAVSMASLTADCVQPPSSFETISLGFAFTLGTQHERRELVAVCRTLLEIGVLQRVVGDEEAFVQTRGEQADALYDVQRRTLAGLLAAVRGPSTWRPEDAPETLEERLSALVDEHVADSDEGRRTALRHQLARRLSNRPGLAGPALGRNSSLPRNLAPPARGRRRRRDGREATYGSSRPTL